MVGVCGGFVSSKIQRVPDIRCQAGLVLPEASSEEFAVAMCGLYVYELLPMLAEWGPGVYSQSRSVVSFI